MSKILAVLTTVCIVGSSSGAWALAGYDGDDNPLIPSNVQEPEYRPATAAHYARAAHHAHMRHHYQVVR